MQDIQETLKALIMSGPLGCHEDAFSGSGWSTFVTFS